MSENERKVVFMNVNLLTGKNVLLWEMFHHVAPSPLDVQIEQFKKRRVTLNDLNFFCVPKIHTPL